VFTKTQYFKNWIGCVKRTTTIAGNISHSKTVRRILPAFDRADRFGYNCAALPCEGSLKPAQQTNTT